LEGALVPYKGAYLLTDNGYARWRIMQCPIKSSTNMNELKWSTRLESVRKDVECTFGILKGRFQILRSRILFHSQKKVDNIFVSACILHNMNLRGDNLDTRWKDDANWERPEDEDDQDLREGRELLRIRTKMNLPEEVIDFSAERQRQIIIENEEQPDDSYYLFRSLLIDHYNFCHNNDLLEWI
jgi:Plant transposon protein